MATYNKKWFDRLPDDNDQKYSYITGVYGVSGMTSEGKADDVHKASVMWATDDEKHVAAWRIPGGMKAIGTPIEDLRDAWDSTLSDDTDGVTVKEATDTTSKKTLVSSPKKDTHKHPSTAVAKDDTKDDKDVDTPSETNTPTDTDTTTPDSETKNI